MANRINRCIELLEQDQAIYYVGPHTGHVLTHEQGRKDAGTWADYINVGMEHGAFDMAGLAAYLRGLVDGGPTRSGHRTPTVIVEAPVNGTDEANVRYNAWQFRQILGRGAHGILLCQAETRRRGAGLRRGLPLPAPRSASTPRSRRRWTGCTARAARRGRAPAATARHRHARPRLGSHRGAGLGPSTEEYMERCDPWPLNPQGELLLGVKLESPEGVANCEEILAVPGLGFAEIGPGDLGLSLGYPPCRASRTRRRWRRRASDLRRLPQQRPRLPGGLHAGQHRGADRRGRAGDRRPQRGSRHRPRASEAGDAGVGSHRKMTRMSLASDEASCRVGLILDGGHFTR